MEQEVKVEGKREEYVCRETGLYLTNPVDISFYMCDQNDEVLRNLLLGKFTKEGKYSIDRDYLIELVKIKKTIAEKKENVYLLKAKLLEIELKFTLTIENFEQDKKIATLCFVEVNNKIDDTKEVLKTIVARYKDDADIYFLEKAFKVFNVKTQEGIDGDDINEEELSNILRRYKEMLMLRKKRVESLDYICNTYIDQVLSILRRYPSKFSEYVLRKYGEKLLEFNDGFGKLLYFVKMKNMLDKIIAGAILEQRDPTVAMLLEKAKSEFVENYKTMHKELLAEQEKAPAPKKTEEKAKAASGSSGGAKKGGKAKKKAAAKAKPKAKGKAAGTQYYAPYTPPQETKKETPKEEQKKPDVNRVELSMKFIDKMLGEMEKKNEAIAKNAFFNVIQPTALKTSEKSNEMTL